MPPSHICSTSRALYRVFIASPSRTSTSVPILYAPAFAPSPASVQAQTAYYGPRTIIRTKKYTKDTRRHALSDYYIMDRAIKADQVNLVDENGKFYRGVSISEALGSFNNATHHLVQMTPGKVDEFGRADPNDLPTCRVVTKMDLRAQHERKLETQRRQEKGQSTGPSSKSLELNWAIAGGDLKHRMERLKEFLEDGRKVEVVLGPKKGKRKATADEAQAVMTTVRDAVAECKGSSEVKSEGNLGGIMTIVFQGRQLEEKRGNEK